MSDKKAKSKIKVVIKMKQQRPGPRSREALMFFILNMLLNT